MNENQGSNFLAILLKAIQPYITILMHILQGTVLAKDELVNYF